MNSRTRAPLALGVFLALELALTAVVSCSSEHPSGPSAAPAARADEIAKRIGAGAKTSGFEIAASGRLRAIDPSGHGYAAEVELAGTSAGRMRVADERSKLGLEVSLDGARDARAEIVGGFVRYASAIAGDADVIQRVARDGVEDFLIFERAPAIESVRYRLEIGDAGGLRLFGRTLEILDRSGVPRLRVEPPVVVDASGARRRASLAVEGCAVDSDARPAWDRPLTPPGASSCTMLLDWTSAHAVYPVVVDPSWVTTGWLVIPREAHTATALANGNVLLVGGFDEVGDVIPDSELYAPPPLGIFSLSSELKIARGAHSATLLASSKILFAGGTDAANGGASMSSAEIYDPQTSAFSLTLAPMIEKRTSHTATLLQSGKVLMAGGVGSQTPATNWAEVFDPGMNTFAVTAGPSMSVRRSSHGATLLTKPGPLVGQVLLTGGVSGLFAQASAERYDPSIDGFAPTAAPMLIPRAFQTSTELPDGTVLIAGGSNPVLPTNAADLYTPLSDTFVKTADLPTARADHTALVLGSGQVLLVGGENDGELPDGGMNDGGPTVIGDSAIYSPMQKAFAQASPLLLSRRLHSATLLTNQVLVAGGRDNVNILGDAELFGIPCSTNGDCGSNHCSPAESVCCDEDCSDLCASCTALGKGAGVDGVCGFAKEGASAAVCQAEVAVVIQCDGKGGVHDPIVTMCKEYGCSGNACATSCQGNVGCSTTAYCLPDNTCKIKTPTGLACADAKECASGFCENKTCCLTTCTGQCEACDVQGNPGTCTPVTGEPHQGNPACAGTDPDCKSVCDGKNVSTCTNPKDTLCGLAICTDAVLTPNVCDGKGQCQIGTPKKCDGSLECEGANACKAACAKDIDCVSGYLCNTDHECIGIEGSECDGDHTIVFQTGKTKDCAPYGCEGQLCRETCRDVRDCVEPGVCDRSNHCVPAPAPVDATAACALTRGTNSESRAAWTLALGLGALVLRRRRSTTSKPSRRR